MVSHWLCQCGEKLDTRQASRFRGVQCPRCGRTVTRTGNGNSRAAPAAANTSKEYVRVSCACGARFKARAELAGRKVQCSKCGTAPKYRDFRVLADELKRKRDDYIKHKDRYAPGEVAKYRQMADTMCLLVEVAQENSDIEVVTHEVTHQMAGNTGLLPRSVQIPTWADEGLATFFEAPEEASWSGIGAVNKERLDWYRSLQGYRKYSNIDFVVRDEIFTTSANVVGELHGYGQSWGLTHFLMNERFDDLMRYYRRLGELPPDLIVSPDVYERIFNEVFGDDRTRVDLQWRSYMSSLKTDLDVFLEEAGR